MKRLSILLTAAAMALVVSATGTPPAVAPTAEPPEPAAKYEAIYYWEGNDPTFTGYDYPKKYSRTELALLSQMLYEEARGCTPEEQRLVIWTAFQRADNGEWGTTLTEVLTAPGEFAPFEDAPVPAELYALCEAEAEKWERGEEPPLLAPYAVELPYLFFDGDGRHNWFRREWR